VIKSATITTDKHPMPLTVVVGSGRCGSTMVSRVLNEHPDVLSMSELRYVLEDGHKNFTRSSIDGSEMWGILSTPDPVLDALFSSGLLDGMTYPRDGRFKPDTGIPPICLATLALLTDDPDALFDVLAAEVPTWPSRSAADQYLSLFSFLGQHLGKRVTVERTGGSLMRMESLRRQFPEARFVHLHRDGPDCAVSMSRHPMFRLFALTQILARISAAQPDDAKEIPEELRRLVEPPIDMERMMSFPIPLTDFGDMWSALILAGVPLLAELPPDCWTSMSYEKVLADPAAELTRLADFIGVTATPQWLTAATAKISRPRPANISAELPPDALIALRKACEPGAAAIAAAESRLA
jgi:hypothetical protein